MGDMIHRVTSFCFVAYVAIGCGSAPPPKPTAPRVMKQNAPFEADVAGHHLSVRFADSPASDSSHVPPRIATIELDGATLYPRDCAAKSKTKLLACSNAHRAVKDADDLHAVAHHETETQIQLLVAGRSGSNLECGAHDYWLLRVDKSGATASEPAAGCFTLPSLDPDALNPVVEWGASLTVRTFDEKSSSCTLVLQPGANLWKVTRAKKA